MRVPTRVVVLVEGVSDQIAVETLARRRGHDFPAAGVAVVPIGGSKGIRRALTRFGPTGLDLTLAGIYDAGEEADFRRGLEHAGFGTNLGREDLASLGFFVCIQDLEDELIRALGVDAVQEVVTANGELRSFRTLQKQAAQRGRSTDAQLRRFMGSRGGRKIRYAQLLVDALDLSAVPRPLDRLLDHVSTSIA